LFSAKDRFDLTFALSLLSNAWSGGKCKESEYGH